MKLEIRFYLETKDEIDIFENEKAKDNLDFIKNNAYAKICLIRYFKSINKDGNKIQTN